MSKINPNHKCFAGRVISNPIVLGKASNYKTLALKAVTEHGYTHKALEVMRETGVDPDKLKASSLVRVKFLNSKVLKPTYLLNIPCTLTQLCVQEIKKGSTVMFMAEGIAPWTEKNRKMENGDKIHDPFNYVFDTLVLDVEAETDRTEPRPIDLTFDESPKARAMAKTGTAARTLEVAKILETEFQQELAPTEPVTETEMSAEELASTGNVIEGPFEPAPEEVLVP